MKKQNIKKIGSLLGILLLGSLVAACDSNESDKITNASTDAPIKVGTMGTYNPFTFVTPDGKLTGYDLEVLEALAKEDPSLQFEFIASPWDTLFPGLESDRFQLLANQITETPERKKKYLLTHNQYFNATSQFIINSERTDIKTLEDLKGKKVGLTVGDAHTLHAEQWNKEKGNLFEIVYYESDLPTILQDIENGRIDATFNDPIVAREKAEAQGLKITPFGQTILSVPTYFIAKNDEQGKDLIDKLDKGLLKLKENGTLSELSLKWFGVDYTQNRAG
ncbi:transporter substrate-binding domain-containing protein [Thorsellia kenyensis]|uniref:Transporter substrate-binding domain-containing protein n=1 Tax=Thorsellia kenyensis TaxID=1549888 RepID=A0ABV6CAW3_9GAMM